MSSPIFPATFASINGEVQYEPCDFAAVVIGALAGAFDAFSAILPKLPANYPLPILVVVHLLA